MTHKTGRPAIGTPVTVTLPDAVIAEAEELAAGIGVSRAEMIRLAIITGLAMRRSSREETPLLSARDREAQRFHEELRPAADLLVSWIAADPEKSRARFVAYYRAASDPRQLIQLLLDATREGVAAGWLVESLSGVLIGRLSAPDDFRLRGQLFFEFAAELGDRGVRISPPGPGDPDESGI